MFFNKYLFVNKKERILIFDEQALSQFAQQFKKVRVKNGFTQEQLSYKSEITLSQIARIETVKTNPTLSTIFALCKAMDVKPEEVFKNIDLK